MSTREIIYAAAGASGPPVYIEDVFSTYLYTGNATNQTITNGIDLAGKGGLTWIKARSSVTNNLLFDTVRGATIFLRSDSTGAQVTNSETLTSFNSNGFSLGADNAGWSVNLSGVTYASWTFREQPKFFDIVTYTGNDTNRTIAHNLGSVPGMIIVKRTSAPGAGGNWQVYHRSLGNDQYLSLNRTDTAAVDNTRWNNTTPTSTVFSLGTNTNVNADGATYVAYLFAHDAGGFGTSGTDNVISCGSFTGDSTVTLGYEPQYVMFKRTDSAGNWRIIDNMRGMPVIASSTGSQQVLFPNLTSAESTDGVASPTATGFQTFLGGGTYIYMAIRRGPMKTPTSGTSVFSPNRETTTANPQTITTGFPVDLTINTTRNDGQNIYVNDRLRGGSTTSVVSLFTNLGNAESTGSGAGLGFDNNTGIVDNGWWNNTNAVFWNFRRAPGFFDEVCYTGTGSTPQNVTHNLGVAPELMIVKVRSAVRAWAVYAGNAGQYLTLNATDAVTSNTNVWGNTAPTSSVFRVGNFSSTNPSGERIVAYLFATLAGVSKVGSYTGTGSTQTINAGLPTGARFVLIKRTDDVGNWWVWDTARGMVAGTDPRLALNLTTAELNNNWVYTVTNGFQIVTTDATVNASGGSYIYLAIA